MKQFTNSRKVVIMQNTGHENIEQAIFILKRGAEEKNEDYILDEAKKIVKEFVIRNGMGTEKMKNVGTWIALGCIFIIAVTAFCVYKLL